MKIILSLLAASILVAGFVVAAAVKTPQQITVGGAGENAAKFATSSTIQVGPQQVMTLFSAEATRSCSGRVVGTVGTPIQLSFGGSVVPTATRGFTQGASTTVMYDSNTYGCDALTAYAPASTTITIGRTGR